MIYDERKNNRKQKDAKCQWKIGKNEWYWKNRNFRAENMVMKKGDIEGSGRDMVSI